MIYTPSTYNGLAINDGTNFQAGFENDNGKSVFNAPDKVITTVERAHRAPQLATVQLQEKVFLLNVECKGADFPGQWDTLKIAFFDGDDEKPLVCLDKNGNPWTLMCVATGQPQLITSGMQIALTAADPMFTFGKTDTWTVTASGQTKAITPIGNASTRPVFTFTPGLAKGGGYTERRFSRTYNPKLTAYSLYAYDVTHGGLNTAALIADSTISNQVNKVGGITAGDLTIPIDTPVGGGLDLGAGVANFAGEQVYYTSITGGNMIVYDDGAGTTGRGWGGTAAASHADNTVGKKSHMLANGNDVAVLVDGVSVPMWFGGGGINSTTTMIFILLTLAPKQELTLLAAMGTGAVSTVSFTLNASNRKALLAMPAKGTFSLGTEVFSYTAKTITAKVLKVTGVKRSLYNTGVASYAKGATVRWIQHSIFQVNGKYDAGTRDQDDSQMPLIDMTASTNLSWVWTIFTDLTRLRQAGWKLAVQKTTGKNSRTYTGSHTADADPATEMGLWMQIWMSNGMPQGETATLIASYRDQAGVTTITDNGALYRYNGNWVTKAGLQKSIDGLTWTDQYNLTKPASAQTWTAFSHSGSSLAGTYNYLQYILEGSIQGLTGNNVALEVQGLTPTKDRTQIPQGELAAVDSTYHLDVTMDNDATGEEFSVDFVMKVGESLQIDCENKVVTYLADGQDYNGALTSPVAFEWMTFKPGVTNNLTLTELNVANDVVGLAWNEKLQ